MNAHGHRSLSSHSRAHTNTNPQDMCALFSVKMTIWYCYEKKERYETNVCLLEPSSTGYVICVSRFATSTTIKLRASGQAFCWAHIGIFSIKTRSHTYPTHCRVQILVRLALSKEQKMFSLHVTFTIRFDTFGVSRIFASILFSLSSDDELLIESTIKYVTSSLHCTRINHMDYFIVFALEYIQHPVWRIYF